MASIDVSDDSTKYQDEYDEEVLEDGIEDLDIQDDGDDANGDKKQPKANNQSSSLVKQFVSSKQPFYKMSLPIKFSEPRSLLEKFTDMGLFLDIFLNASKIESEENRFLEVLKFYISGWIQQREAKNPFNPVIGEVHTCKWVHKDGSTTQYIAEQISHHPPSSAFCFHNKDQGVVFHSYLSPSSKFSGNSFESSMDGKLVYEFPNLDEEYIAEAPKIVVRGVVVGSLSTEVTGSTTLNCKKTGYYAEIEFKGKGLFKNKNSLIAKVRHPSSKKSLYTLEGKWDGTVIILNSKSNSSTLFLDIKNDGLEPILPDEDEQQDNFSRKVWKNVISNINKGNSDEAQNHKHNVEENQRALAKAREGKQWVPVHFNKSENTFHHEKLSEIRKSMKN
ncbi:hypothetical protein CYY_003908 [Polysphondylium violaceum]|uniref:Oxysterol binding family protein n=1 Tax=Polysphondylium violaceum TaxID=133409 RepID=A0A8J4UZS9_9MYCE|nr:hypothetical protein CYY_003908 [Polysphondylium violaceum]